MVVKDFSNLSRAVSHALRHEPWLYGLDLDDRGSVAIEELVLALREASAEWSELDEDDIRKMTVRADKKRHEIMNGRIQALYGHSGLLKPLKVPAPPPSVLYHGTSPNAAERILLEGLRSMSRQYVHLSIDAAGAAQVGRRKAHSPTILEVDAARADAEGIKFYRGNDQVWLADLIPAEFIRRS